MKAAIVNLKDLNPDCWSANRAVHTCYKCSHYDYCKNKIVNKKYDALRLAAQAYEASAADLRRQAKEM